jgi:NAD(P)H dehydrogenase (quinone)
MPKVLVLFYSRTGNTARIADAVAEGAAQVRFTEVEIRKVPELAPEEVIAKVPGWKEVRDEHQQKYRSLGVGDVEELVQYDALILGSPTRYGSMSAELKVVMDATGPLWSRGALVDKVGGAFTSVSTPHGGHETTLWSIMTAMGNFGMIIVPPGYTDPLAFKAGSPYGATATTGGGAPTGDDLAFARHQGKRVATVTGWVRHAMGHEANGAHGQGHGHSHG